MYFVYIGGEAVRRQQFGKRAQTRRGNRPLHRAGPSENSPRREIPHKTQQTLVKSITIIKRSSVYVCIKNVHFIRRTNKVITITF